MQENTVRESEDNLKVIDKIKMEVSERFKLEMKSKQEEILRVERIYKEQIDDLEKEVTRLSLEL